MEEIILARVYSWLIDYTMLPIWLKIVMIVAVVFIFTIRWLANIWISARNKRRHILYDHPAFRIIGSATGYAHYTKLILKETNPRRKKRLVESRKQFMDQFHKIHKVEKHTILGSITNILDDHAPTAIGIATAALITIFFVIPILAMKRSVQFTDLIGTIVLFLIIYVIYRRNFS